MLSHEQQIIRKNMLTALGIVLSLAFLALFVSYQIIINRTTTLLLALILPTCSYVFGIGRIASLRFFDESVSNPLFAGENLQLNVLKQYLSNTHEQLFLALIVYALLAWSLPLAHTYLTLLLSCCFVLGRILFVRGYKDGAAGRSLGFALTFYSNVIGLVIGIGFLLYNVI